MATIHRFNLVRGVRVRALALALIQTEVYLDARDVSEKSIGSLTDVANRRERFATRASPRVGS